MNNQALKTKDWGKYLIPVKKPYLSEKNISDRKLFFAKVKEFGIKKIMKNVAFSDEMSIRLGPHKNRRDQGIRDVPSN